VASSELVDLVPSAFSAPGTQTIVENLPKRENMLGQTEATQKLGPCQVRSKLACAHPTEAGCIQSVIGDSPALDRTPLRGLPAIKMGTLWINILIFSGSTILMSAALSPKPKSRSLPAIFQTVSLGSPVNRGNPPRIGVRSLARSVKCVTCTPMNKGQECRLCLSVLCKLRKMKVAT
jgi:hypothetical protein